MTGVTVMPRHGDWTVADLADIPDDGLQYALQPDVLEPLLLAVEVLSPSTRSKDLLLKRGLYQDSGVTSSWVVDPEEPSVLELEGGRYVEAGSAVGDQVLRRSLPFPVELQPALLLDAVPGSRAAVDLPMPPTWPIRPS